MWYKCQSIGFQESSVFRGGIVGRQRKHWCKVVDSFSSLGLDKGKWTVETRITDLARITDNNNCYSRRRSTLTLMNSGQPRIPVNGQVLCTERHRPIVMLHVVQNFI